MRSIATLGVASDVGGNHKGCQHGPDVLRHSPFLNKQSAEQKISLDWLDILRPDQEQDTIESLRSLTSRIAVYTEKLIRERQPFLVLGGDHSQAMGIWRGVLSAVPKPQSFGLIWIDAHMDAHDFSTSPSGNIHGMPLAALLGNQEYRLRHIAGQSPRLNPDLVMLIGVRSYQPEEAEFLKKLGVRILTMEELGAANNQATAISEAIHQVSGCADCYGISIDVDGLDPRDAPAVGTPEAGGICTEILCQALSTVNGDPGFIGMEIAEFLPLLDKNQLTEQAISKLVLSAFSPLNQALSTSSQITKQVLGISQFRNKVQ